jgi:hypothetical protein
MGGEAAVAAVHTAYEGEEVGTDRVLWKVGPVLSSLLSC